MSQPRQRMVPPQLAVDLSLTPLVKRAVYIGIMQLCEDSGCFIWSPRDVRSVALPLEQVSDNEVEEIMRQLVSDERIWSYEAEGVRCGYVPAFPEINRSLTRWNVPQTVPLPGGITFEEIESANRYGSCKYTWPKSKAALTQPTSQTATLSPSHSLTQGAATSLRPDCDQPGTCIECNGSGVKNGSKCGWCNGTGVT